MSLPAERSGSGGGGVHDERIRPRAGDLHADDTHFFFQCEWQEIVDRNSCDVVVRRVNSHQNGVEIKPLDPVGENERIRMTRDPQETYYPFSTCPLQSMDGAVFGKDLVKLLSLSNICGVDQRVQPTPYSVVLSSVQEVSSIRRRSDRASSMQETLRPDDP